MEMRNQKAREYGLDIIDIMQYAEDETLSLSDRASRIAETLIDRKFTSGDDFIAAYLEDLRLAGERDDEKAFDRALRQLEEVAAVVYVWLGDSAASGDWTAEDQDARGARSSNTNDHANVSDLGGTPSFSGGVMAPAERKYTLPEFLVGTLDQAAYQRWLSRKAEAHKRRDRERGNATATREGYMLAIHDAVLRSDGRDEYTGLSLRWDLVSSYDNEQAAAGGRAYKKSLADLPTVDHVGDGLGPADFAICSWRVNDAKNDLTIEEFLEVCRQVLRHHEGAR